MIKPPPVPNEAERLRELLSLEILDTESEEQFDDAVALASYITGCPISLISLIDIDRQWFKAKVGLEATETPRDISFCGHAIHSDRLFEVPNATQDVRFHDNPLVTGDLGIRFYAGQPIVTSGGHRIGTLCTIDREERALTDEQRRLLASLAKQVSSLIELRLLNRKQQLKSLTQSQFLSSVSHEIRTPLTSVLGYASVARETVENESPSSKALTFLENVERHSKHILSIIANVLDLSKLSGGQTPLDLVSFTPDDLREHVESLFALEAQKKNLALKVVVQPEVPDHLAGDLTRIKQIVINLVGNALKFTTKGSITITLGYTKDRELLHIGVRDTGVGMTAEQSRGLFQPFAQGDESINAKYGGTGLGLALSRQTCEAMGGDLALAESAPGKGSLFVASVHCPPSLKPTESTETTAVKLDAVARTLKSIGSMASILVADASSDTRFIFKHYLKQFTMDADEAQTGTEALNKISSKNYDVIFLDLEMPETNGIEVLNRIRAMRSKPKIVAFTAHDTPEHRERFKKAGFDFYLPKPFTPAQVGAILFETLVYSN